MIYLRTGVLTFAPSTDTNHLLTLRPICTELNTRAWLHKTLTPGTEA